MIDPNEQKINQTRQVIKGIDTVSLDRLVWVIAKLEDRITDLENVIISMQENQTFC